MNFQNYRFLGFVAAVSIMITVLAASVNAQSIPGCSPACTFDLDCNPLGNVVSPDGQYLFVGGDDGTVKKVRLSDHSVVCSILVAGGPMGLAITPDGQYVYACNTVNQYYTTKFDAATCTNPIDIPGGTNPSAIDITPDGSTACIVNHWSGFLQLVSVATDAEIGRVYGVGNGAMDVEVTPDGKYAYVSLRTTGPSPGPPWILKIDLLLQSIVDTIPVMGEGLNLTQDGTELWVAGQTRSFAYVISTVSDSLIDSVAVPSAHPADVKVSPDGQFAYVSLPYDSVLAVISVPDRSLVNMMPTGKWPVYLALSPDGVRIFISNMASGCITEYTRTAICAVGYQPQWPHDADIDCDGQINPVDAVLMINFVYKGIPFPAPYPWCAQ